MSEQKLQSLLDYCRTNSTEKVLERIKRDFLVPKFALQQLNELVEVLDTTLNRSGFVCQLFPYGSTQTGLALKEKFDLDVHVAVGGQSKWPFIWNWDGKRDYERCLYCATRNNVLHYDQIESSLNSMATKLRDPQGTIDLRTAFVRYLNKIPVYSRYRRELSEELLAQVDRVKVIAIVMCTPNTKVPICRVTLQLRDGEKKVIEHFSIDLKVNRPISLAHTRLVRGLCRLEPRFKVVCVIVLYWAKCVTSMVNSRVVTSFQLVLMVMARFQSLRLLPPVRKVILRYFGRARVDDLNCNMAVFPNQIYWNPSPFHDQKDVNTLVYSFFNYFSKEIASQRMISTHTGLFYSFNNRLYRDRYKRREDKMDKLNWQVGLSIMDPLDELVNATYGLVGPKYAKLRAQMIQDLPLFQKALQ